MTNAYSNAQKKRWRGLNKKQRSKLMSDLARKKWASMSVAQKNKHAAKMRAAKKKK